MADDSEYSREDEAMFENEVEFWERYIAKWIREHDYPPPARAYALLAQARVRLESCRQWLRIHERKKAE